MAVGDKTMTTITRFHQFCGIGSGFDGRIGRMNGQCGKNDFRMIVTIPPTVIAIPHLRGANSICKSRLVTSSS
ncbi:hypothetical protein SIID45300_01660 [Candidatus Magnetaquicoccaceae bacterium FCR-1]|uniref:Uncharacterized protein n=1 Tax=Candidatus Magnetaquiglobus chichijimensis TaxID=3141448 RepID=A0ABQ0C9G0_9PROT